MPADDPDPEELRERQDRRAREEARQAEEASEPTEVRAHDRRAEKAAYLRDKLAEQAEAGDG